MITGFEDALLAVQHLDGDTIAQVRAITTTPKPSVGRPTRKPKPIVAEEDVNMGDVGAEPQSTPRPLRQGKGKARAVSPVSESVVYSTQESVGGAGTKRGLAESPSQVGNKSKRSRTAKKKERAPDILTIGNIDLSDYTWDEDADLDVSLIPRAKNKVSLRETSRKLR